jgi:hypothetical protein
MMASMILANITLVSLLVLLDPSLALALALGVIADY